MANLTREQVANYVAAKRRRDRGDPYMENRIALTDVDKLGIYGLLDGQPLREARAVTEYVGQPKREGQFRWWDSDPNRGRFVRYLVGRGGDPATSKYYKRPPRMPTSLAQSRRSWFPNPKAGKSEVSFRSDMAGKDLEDTLAHEVGHRAHYISGLLGTHAGDPRSGIDPYTEKERIYTPEKSDRWHNVLYGESDSHMKTHGGERSEIDKEVAKADAEIAEKLARMIMQRQRRRK